MKYFIAVALLAAVASARFVVPADLPPSQAAEIQEILDAINSPSTDPATAVMLEQLLLEILGLAKPEGDHTIDVGPAIVEDYHPILPGPVLVDFPEESLNPTPVAPASSSPLVQIIVNVQGQAAGAPQEEKPVVNEPEVDPTPVIVVDHPEVDPTPVIVVDQAPVAPVVIGPEILN